MRWPQSRWWAIVLLERLREQRTQVVRTTVQLRRMGRPRWPQQRLSQEGQSLVAKGPLQLIRVGTGRQALQNSSIMSSTKDQA